MTQGVLMFAFNNQHVDYLAMASWSAQRIHRHLDLPVCVVTDTQDLSRTQAFDQVINIDLPEASHIRYFKDYKKTAAWHNSNRVNAFDLTPWDHTLVLDADYVVASDQLKSLFEIDQDFVAHRWAHDIAGPLAFHDNNWFGLYRMPMTWATVMCFRRSQKAKHIFDIMQMIRDNWNHYRHLYQIGENTYRNDYSLSIAQNLVDGHVLDSPHIPWSLATVTPETKLEQVDTDTYKIQYESNHSKLKWIHVQQDFHAMGKQALEKIVANNS
jgi:hypothetical protein